MELPSGFLGIFARVWAAIRANPCTIEILDNHTLEGYPWIRIRNDSSLVTHIYDVSVSTKYANLRDLQLALTPLSWILDYHVDDVDLGPGEFRDFPFDPDDINDIEGRKDPVMRYVISVRHSRSTHPAKKSLTVKRLKTKQWTSR